MQRHQVPTAIFLPSHIRHEVQSHQVTTEPSSSLRTSITKCRVPKSRRSHLPPSHIRHEVQIPQVTTEPSSSLRTSATKCRVPKSRRSHLPPFAHPSRSAESPSHDGAIFLPSHIRHEVQSHQVTTEPSSSLRTSVTKYRVTKSRRSHLPPFAHPSRSAESPSHDGAIFLPSHIRHEVQSHQVTTEPPSSLRTSITKCRFPKSFSLRTSVTKCRCPQVTTEPSSSLRTSVTKCRVTKSRRSHLRPFAHPSRSADSPSHDGAILRPFAHPSRSADSLSHDGAIILPLCTHHEVQSPKSRRSHLPGFFFF